SFRLPRKPFGVTVNIIMNEFFDDTRSVFADSRVDQESRGRFLHVLDLGSGGSIYPAILETAAKSVTVGEWEKVASIDATFACTMENPTMKVSHVSQT